MVVVMTVGPARTVAKSARKLNGAQSTCRAKSVRRDCPAVCFSTITRAAFDKRKTSVAVALPLLRIAALSAEQS